VGNDFSYSDVFVKQLMNFARKGDIIFIMSVSGNSPNLVKVVEWCKTNGVYSIILAGGEGGKISEIADKAVIIPEMHYGRVEDAHMTICHMIAFAFMENSALQSG
jgi:D-sedoheptulose 7-phosphate isomerase